MYSLCRHLPQNKPRARETANTNMATKTKRKFTSNSPVVYNKLILGFYCEVCDEDFAFPCIYKRHLTSRSHQTFVERLRVFDDDQHMEEVGFLCACVVSVCVLVFACVVCACVSVCVCCVCLCC